MIYRVLLDGNDILNFQERAFVLLSTSLDMELNTAGSFEFTMPPCHPFYDSVRLPASTVEVYEDGELLWFGRPVEVRTDFMKQKTVYCEGALAFFSDTVQSPREYESVGLHAFFAAVIADHNAQVTPDRQFTVGAVTVPDASVYRKLNYESTFDVLKKQCLEAEGGYFFLRRANGVNCIDWYAEMPYACSQPAEFGLNLLDLSSETDGSALATCVIPLGDDGLTAAEANGGSPVIVSEAAAVCGRITRAVTFPGVKDARTLYEKGAEYLGSSQFTSPVIECSAAELHFQNGNYDAFRVGQTVRCRSAPHLVDREFPLVKMSVRLDTAAKKITLGSVRKQTLTKLYKDESSASVRDGLGALEERLSKLENDRGGCRIYINGVLATSSDSIYFETA